MSKTPIIAPPLSVAQWFNADAPITLEALRGRVVVIHAFQMLCPGCVADSLPQAMRIHHSFSDLEVAVLGLHTVFEHHEAMAPRALKAFLHEYRITFPVGVDLPAADSPIPTTMQAYRLKGTPSLIVIDREGGIRLNHFGRIDDLQLGVLLGTLISEPAHEQPTVVVASDDDTTLHSEMHDSCNEYECVINQ
jgi:hypothetical protein